MTVASRDRLRRVGLTALRIVAVAALYYAFGRLGLLQQLVRGQVTPLWPPTGIALAGLLLFGLRVWPGIALGAFLINIPLGPTTPAVLAIAAGNTLAPLCSYALLRRSGFRTQMNRLQDALALVFLGALTGMLISATVGSGSLSLAHALPPGGFWLTWWVWWTGDAMGVLLVTPLLLVLRSAHWPKDIPRSGWAEGSLLVAATIAVGLLQTSPAPLLFLGFPLLTWAAFRFQRAGATPCALAVSTFAILAATRRTGPFAGHTLLTDMISLQAYNGAATLTALLLAAAITERNQTQAKIEEACRRLAEMVARAAPDTGGLSALPDAQDDGGGERRADAAVVINQQLRRGARGSGTAAILATRNTTLCRAHAARPARAALAGVPGFASVDGLASVVAAAALHRMAIYGRRAHTSPRPLGLRIGPAQTTTPGFTVRKGTSRPPEYEALSTTKAQATTNI